MTTDTIQTELPAIERLSADDFKRTAYARGWKMHEVAQRWGMTKIRISQICNHKARPLYYDDAVRGLPLREIS